jgi:hypothetical protein
VIPDSIQIRKRATSAKYTAALWAAHRQAMITKIYTIKTARNAWAIISANTMAESDSAAYAAHAFYTASPSANDDIQREVHDALAKRTTVRAFSDVFAVWNPPGFLKLT